MERGRREGERAGEGKKPFTGFWLLGETDLKKKKKQELRVLVRRLLQPKPFFKKNCISTNIKQFQVFL